MNEGMISKRYAKALLLYAVEQKSEDVIFSEMKKLASAFASEPKLRIAMDNPMVTATDKMDLVKACVGGKASQQLIQFINLVLKNKRESYLQVIALSFCDLYRNSKHINISKLITATAVDKTVIEKMKGLLQTIKPGTLEFETSIDPSIEGGFVLYIDTYRLDASVASQLKRIKQKFVAENSKIA